MSEPLTDRQQQVLDFINAHHRQTGVSPSLREIQAHFGLASPFGIKRHVDALTEKGALRRLDGKARGLLPSSHPRRGALAEIPLFGTIPAGLPVEAEQQPDSYISVDTMSLGVRHNTKLFALRVRGDSMVDDGILDGDLVIIARRERADNGEMVVANVNGEVTLKRIYKEGERVRLQPANSLMSPIYAPARDVAVQGVVVGLMRRF